MFCIFIRSSYTENFNKIGQKLRSGMAKIVCSLNGLLCAYLMRWNPHYRTCPSPRPNKHPLQVWKGSRKNCARESLNKGLDARPPVRPPARTPVRPPAWATTIPLKPKRWWFSSFWYWWWNEYRSSQKNSRGALLQCLCHCDFEMLSVCQIVIERIGRSYETRCTHQT